MPIPSEWGRVASEGLVVEFVTDAKETWVGNFRPGFNGIDDVRRHPNGHDVLVVSGGSAWEVDPNLRTAKEVGHEIDSLWPVSGPEGFVMSRQGSAFARLGPQGPIWYTRRISWDGFKDVQFSSTLITGLAWAPWEPEWTPFTIDLKTGLVEGGSYNEPDGAHWEILANGRSV